MPPTATLERDDTVIDGLVDPTPTPTVSTERTIVVDDTTALAMVASALAETPVIPTRQNLLDRAMREFGCTAEQAKCWYEQMRQAARSRSGVHHIRQRALTLMHDAVLTKVMPDDAVAEPGSLHADAEAHFSELVGHDVVLTHRNADKGTVRDCQITLEARRN